MSHVTVLAGGLCSAKFLVGLVDVLEEEDIQVIVNVGDDDEVWGLYVCPDIDRILNALAGELDPARGWQRHGETFQSYGTARKLGLTSKHKIGDRALATHLLRTQLLKAGRNLEEATQELADRFGLGLSILPVTNDRVRTRVETSEGDMTVGEFYAEKSAEAVGVRYEGAGSAAASPSAIDSIMTASRVILAPADPVRSLDAILAIPGIRDALTQTAAGVVAVSPVVGSHAVGDTDSRLEPLMRATGTVSLSVCAVAGRYKDFLNHFVIHTTDLASLDAVREIGPGVWVENIVISNPEDASRLAGRVANKERSVGSGV